MIHFARSKVGVVKDRANDIFSQLKNPTRELSYPIIIMFHSVSKNAELNWGPWKYSVTPIEFEQKITQLTEKREVVPIDDLVNWLVKGDPLPDRPAVVTFDDGYRDFITAALPILKQYGVPSTVYISTGLSNSISRSPFEQRLASSIISSDSISISTQNISYQSKLKNTGDEIHAYNELRRAVKHGTIDDQEQLLAELGDPDFQPDSVLNQDEIVSLESEPLVTIGSHGHEHLPFSSLSSDEQLNNVKTSREWLSEILESPPEHFSFPYGSYNSSAIETVRESGFKSAVTTNSRVVFPRDWNCPYTIPRFDASTTSFEATI